MEKRGSEKPKFDVRSIGFPPKYGDIVQWIERKFSTLCVRGSIPLIASK